MALATLHETDSDVDPEQLLAQERTGANGGTSPFRRRAALAGALVLSLAAAFVALHANGVSLESTSLLFQQKFGRGHGFGHGHGGLPHGNAPPPVKFFTDHDKDNNGQLEGDELTALATGFKEKFNITDADFQEAMEAADKNGDGKLAKAEMPALALAVHRDAAAHKRFEMFDQDQNGKVEGDELQNLTKLMEKHFGVGSKEFQDALTAADKNKDGKLEGDEAAAFLAEVHKDVVPHHPHNGHHQHGGQHQHGGHHQHGPAFDHDGDGKVQGDELKELKEVMAKRSKLSEEDLEAAIKASDKNGDGVLEQQEMLLFLKELHGKVEGKKFEKYDDDGNGKVEGKELEVLESNLTHHFRVSKKDFQKVFQAADANKDGKLEEDEAPLFMQALHKAVMSRHPPHGQLDKDHNGLVEGKELKAAKKSLRAQNKVTDAEFERIFGEADANSDGKLARAEMTKLMAGLHKESMETHLADRAIKGLVDQMLV